MTGFVDTFPIESRNVVVKSGITDCPTGQLFLGFQAFNSIFETSRLRSSALLAFRDTAPEAPFFCYEGVTLLVFPPLTDLATGRDVVYVVGFFTLARSRRRSRRFSKSPKGARHPPILDCPFFILSSNPDGFGIGLHS